MGLNSGKFYDAKKTREYCELMDSLSCEYKEKAVVTHRAYRKFYTGIFFRGHAANTLKDFIKTGAGGTLNEVTDIHASMVENQRFLIESFETMVDSSLDARIEYDTLEKINSDFIQFFKTFLPITEEVRNIVNCLNSEFGEYENFPQPNSEDGLRSFRDICGGDEGTGFIKTCQDRFVEFDYTVNKYLKGRDTSEHAEDLNSRLLNTIDVLNGITGKGEEVNQKYVVQKVMDDLNY